MVPERSRTILEHLRDLADAGRAPGAADAELAEAFVATRSEAAFGALVRRHGPMVLGVCRRVLGNTADAEDALQATFLVCARKLPGLRDRRRLGNWLYGVAYRTARKARTARARRTAHERAAVTPTPRDPLAEISVREAQEIVDQELERLPDRYRAVLILCCLEGLTRDEAARQLGWPAPLLKSRLEQARELLRGRLARRGLPLPAGFLAVQLFGATAEAGVAPEVVASTARAAGAVAVGHSPAGLVSAPVFTLYQGMLRMMFLTRMKWFAAGVLAVLALGALTAAPLLARKAPAEQAAAQLPVRPLPGAGQKQPPLQADALQRWGQAEGVFTAKLVGVRRGPTGLSEPPLYSHTLQFTVAKTLRGTFKPGDAVTGNHSIRRKMEPTFPEGKECLVAVKKSRNGWQVVAVQEATAESVAQAELACALPLGWALADGKLLSPWTVLGPDAWPAAARGKGKFVCAITGRPALLAGSGIAFTVEPVPPRQAIKYTNPDGDGDYKITVKNVTDKAVTVPALLRVGDKILWDDSLVILCQGKVYPIPDAKGVKEPPQPTVLQPGQAVSTVVNALKLKGPEWPRGGYRIEFLFALGERSATHSFYYMSKWHDQVRDKLFGNK